MRVQAVIDRFESNKAVLLLGEEEIQATWPRASLPVEAKEGDFLQIDIQIDVEATIEANAAAESLLKQIVEKNQES